MKQAFLKIGIACMLSSCPRMVDAFAAGNKGKKGKKTVVGKGFGISSKQPSLEEVVAKFPNRIPDNAEECECPCGSDKVYRRCCGPFHKKEKLPSSPIDVLRSRYSAFAWRIPLYIVDTTHPACNDYKKDKLAWVKDMNREGMFDSYEFVNLAAGPQEISEDDEKEGFIDFKVNLRANENLGEDVQGQEIVVRERSRFLCSGEPASWSYAGGDVTSEIEGLEDMKLNH